MTTIPPALVPRILALKTFMGDLWPKNDYAVKFTLADPAGREASTSAQREIAYDRLCMACIRTLQREDRAPLLDPKGDVVLCGGGMDLNFFNDTDLLTNLIAAVEWAKARKESANV